MLSEIWIRTKVIPGMINNEHDIWWFVGRNAIVCSYGLSNVNCKRGEGVKGVVFVRLVLSNPLYYFIVD